MLKMASSRDIKKLEKVIIMPYQKRPRETATRVGKCSEFVKTVNES